MTTTTTPATLAEALARFQADRPRVVKDATNTHFRNTYATLDAFEAAVLPALGRHGLAWTCLPTFEDGALVLRGRLLHGPSGDALECVWPLGGGNPQQLGSAVTYGRRYCLGAVVGVAADEDDDGNAATGAHETTTVRRAQSGEPEPDPWAVEDRRQGARKRAEEPPATPAPPAAQNAVTQAQLRALWAACKSVGIVDKAATLAMVTDVVGRAVESTRNLTKAEASTVLDALAARRSHGEIPAPDASTHP